MVLETPEIRSQDAAVADVIEDERHRQRATLSMIASENHVSPAVLEAQGSVFTNQYAEGYPGKRYYAGCECVDELERIAIERARELWGGDHVNVQPHSGTQANMAVFKAALDPGDTILSLDLNHGGHLSHGHELNFSGEMYAVSQYQVDIETGYIDYEALREHAESVDPDIIVSGYSSYPRTVEWEAIQDIADSVGSYHLSDIAHITGLVAAGVHPSPVGIADFVTGSTHKTIRAGRGGFIISDQEHADAIDRAVMPGVQGGPLVHNIAGKAVGFGEALTPEFTEYAEQTVANAKALADTLDRNGLSLVSGGTDNHLVLVDLRETHDVTGTEIETALADIGVVLNKNAVPGETGSGLNPSGFRAGTPGITTRGFDEAATDTVGNVIADVVDDPFDDAVRSNAKATIDELCREYPLYPTSE